MRLGGAIWLWLWAAAAVAQQAPTTAPLAGVTGAFEGWYPNEDGSRTLLVGYFNRHGEAFEIPVGAANRIEPGGPDQGQPTHFLPGRQWGMFTIRVPKEFDEKKKLRWTLTANGVTTTVPLTIDPLWVVAPYRDATGNTPPWISFEEGAMGSQGPAPGIAKRFEATSGGDSLRIPFWVADDAMIALGQAAIPRGAAVRVRWTKFRGPGEVEFSPASPSVETIPGSRAKFMGRGATRAKFSAPGEYLLELIANDWSGEGGGGFQCCWSTARIAVSVR